MEKWQDKGETGEMFTGERSARKKTDKADELLRTKERTLHVSEKLLVLANIQIFILLQLRRNNRGSKDG